MAKTVLLLTEILPPLTSPVVVPVTPTPVLPVLAVERIFPRSMTCCEATPRVVPDIPDVLTESTLRASLPVAAADTALPFAVMLPSVRSA